MSNEFLASLFYMKEDALLLRVFIGEKIEIVRDYFY